MARENLVPMNKRTKDEVKKIAAKGGVNSGKTRRWKRDLKKAIEEGLKAEIITEDGDAMPCAAGVAQALLGKALKGNLQAIQQLLDLFYGRKQEVEMKGNVVTKLPDLHINFLPPSEGA